MTDTHKRKCFCGAVEIKVIVASVHCHCESCRQCSRGHSKHFRCGTQPSYASSKATSMLGNAIRPQTVIGRDVNAAGEI